MLERSWRKRNFLTILLLPLSLVYWLLSLMRRCAYHLGLLKTYSAPLPVIVVGNLTVGGTGKTPLVVYLVERLRERGYTPGVISRGYGGRADQYPFMVSADTPAQICGDEPALIKRRTDVALSVGPDRQSAIELLIEDSVVDIIICDDGLQHLALQRDIEICIVDETKVQNNHFLLPAGPYRESHARLASVDFLVHHVADVESNDADHSMRLQPSEPVALYAGVEDNVFNPNNGVHAVAGIANPDRFFATCHGFGWKIVAHPFPDHHDFRPIDFDYKDDLPILMTEKDAVKCGDFATERYWYLPVDVKMNAGFMDELHKYLQSVNKRKG